MTLNELFEQNKRNLLNIYFTAGFPQLNSLPLVLNALEEAGADLVEIGIPYSDPMSDGPVIQQSNAKAIANGISLPLIFEQLEQHPSGIPKIMMGYYNPVLQFGMENFCKQCERCGVSGVILPDLPMELWEKHHKPLFEKHGLSNIFLVTPETTEERIRQIDALSSSFIYAVSSSATTGSKKGIREAESYLERLQAMNLNNPVLVGFNISNRADFEFASRYARGGIIGSAFIRHIDRSRDLKADIIQFVNNIKEPRS